MRVTELWAPGPDGAPRPTGCHIAVWLSASGTHPASGTADRRGHNAVLVVPTEPTRGACGVALVPDDSSGGALLNGVRLAPGLHVLDHGDQIAVGDRTLWLSVVPTADEVKYDPELHGEKVYCLRTKARLEPGDSMVICAGTPETECGMRFTAAAWGTGIPCHSCGASPTTTAWQPQSDPEDRSLERLLSLVAQA